jgi:tetratricopeptide (TPR) repeat protein
MMKKFLVFAFLGFASVRAEAATLHSDSLITVLKKEIGRKKVYDREKEQHIARLRQDLSIRQPIEHRYEALVGLFEAYKDYRFDSTFHYANELVDIAYQLKDKRRIAENRLRLGTTLITAGMFKETFDCLRNMDAASLDPESRKSYYVLNSWAWSDLAKYNADRFYAPEDLEKKFLYLDSAIGLTKPGSFEQLILQAQRDPKTGVHPVNYYIQLTRRKLSRHEEAMVVTGLSRYRTGSEKIRLLTIAAINDVKTSTYRAQAMLDLGNELYAQGKLDDAYFFLQQAMDQANTFGARMQRYQVARFLPLVAAERDMRAKQERQEVITVLTWVLVLVVIVVLIGIIIFVQLKQVRAKERIIRENHALLAEKNARLFEEGRIKEEYIGFFFGELSRHILKLDKLKNNVQRKVKSGSTTEVLRQLENLDVQAERRQLFYTFDRIFLKLFPDFIEAVNAMLPSEDQLKPKAPGTLSTQLRILALMRLGINNNEMIAGILEYTVSTVYTYRFRLRSKALVPPEDFEQRIMGIQLATNAS